MDIKKREVFLIIVLLVLNIYAFIINYFNINCEKILIFFLGLSFIILYLKKKKSWSLVLGVITLIVFNFILDIENFKLSSNFFILGILSLYIFYKNHNDKCLFFGAFLIWWGIFSVLVKMSKFDTVIAALFIICLGMIFLTVYILSKRNFGIWTVILNLIILIVSLFFLNQGNNETIKISFYCFCVIILDIILILKNIVKK